MCRLISLIFFGDHILYIYIIPHLSYYSELTCFMLNNVFSNDDANCIHSDLLYSIGVELIP